MTKEKKIKKQKTGVIRNAFVAPFLIFSLLIILFTTFLLDMVLRSGFEMIAEKIHGAEVNISSVSTSFSDLRMTISRVQVTDKGAPEYNQFEIGKIEFALLWDALLRAKAVINLAEVSTIKVNTKRSYPGKVNLGKDAGDAVEDSLNNAKEEFDGNVFGDIAALLGGENLGDIGKLIEGDLESEKKFKQIKLDLKAKEAEIKQNFKNLPDEKELKSFEKRLSKIKFNDLGNLLKAAKVIREVDDLKNDINDAKKSYEKANKSLKTGFKSINQSYKDATNQVNKDIETLSKRAKIPTLNSQNMAKILFGKDILRKVEEYRRYFDTAKEYIPKRKNKVEAPTKRERGKGRDYQFGTPTSYPLLWIKLTKISSDTKQGTVKGEITDITNSQNQIGRPTVLEIEADFPPEKIRNVVATATLDMREVPILKSSIVIGEHPVANQKISDTKEATFIIKSASNQSAIKSTLTEKSLKLTAKNKISNISYETNADSKQVKEVLSEVAKRTPLLTLDATVEGKWSALSYDIRSNLAKAIQTTVQSLVQEKIDKAKKQIRDQVNNQVSKTKNEVNSKINGVKTKYESELKRGEEEFDKLKKNVDKEKKKASKNAEKSAGDLLKNFKL